MLNIFEAYAKTFVLLAFFVLVSLSAFAAGEITLIKDLVNDGNEAVWTDGSGNAITIDAAAGMYGGVKLAAKLSGIPTVITNGVDYDEPLSQTIHLEFPPTLGRNDVQIRGSYMLQLPEMKRIQLEIIYDQFLDSEGARSPLDFYVEVNQRDVRDSNRWTSMQTIRQTQTEIVPLEKERIYRSNDSRYVKRTFLAILSPWAGQEVRLDLVAAAPANVVTRQSARWCSLRLIGTSFDWGFLTRKEKEELLANKSKSKVASKTIKYSTLIFPYEDGELDFDDIHGEDCPVSPVRVGYLYAFFHGSTLSATYPVPIIDATGAIFAFEFHENYMHPLSTEEIKSSLLRGTTLENAAPGLDEATPPFCVMTPEYFDRTKWNYSFMGITDAYAVEVGWDSYVHAFLHVEDWSQDGVTMNGGGKNRTYAYVRVGYARSNTANHAYDLSLKSNADDYPIIECFMPEEAYDHDTAPPKAIYGAQMPCVIKDISGTYYYMFYVRNLDSSPKPDWCDGNDEELYFDIISDVSPDIGFSSAEDYKNMFAQFISPQTPYDWGDRICVARAAVADVISSNYEQNGNPWKKGYYKNDVWTFTEPGIGGLSWPVMNDNRVSPQVLYDYYFDQYMMICREHNVGFYVYLSDNLLDWGEGTMLLPEPPGHEYLDPSLIGMGSSDKLGQQMYDLFFCHAPIETNPGNHALEYVFAYFY